MSIFETINNKSFMKHHAQGFSQAEIMKSYQDEAVIFEKGLRNSEGCR